MPSKLLQIEYVCSTFTGYRDSGDAQRMYRHSGIQSKFLDVAVDKVFDATHRLASSA